jgi:uncharacterized protein YcgI (DUF1989 family)
VRGGQCVDVNVFSLADRRERFHAARTRSLHGVALRTGAALWSNPPWERPLMVMVADTADVCHDVSFPACSELEYARVTGIAGHTNCCDIQAEAGRAWGLGPHDVHDPLNLWLQSHACADGSIGWSATATGPGDHVELLARVDCLVVANPCGDDLFGASGYGVAPVRVTVRAATAHERARWLRPEEPPAGAAAGPAQPPVLDAGVTPRFDASGLQVHRLRVELPEDARALVDGLRRRATYGQSDAAVVRAAVMRWLLEGSGAGTR